MFNKIDKNILDKIITLESDKDIEVIVRVSNIELAKEEIFKNLDYKYFIELPFVSCLAISTNIENVYKLAKNNLVKFISENTHVTSLVYNSKKFINFDVLNKKVLVNGVHSCVVIDTGVYPHVDFCLGKNRIIKFVDLINGKSRMYDDNGHGTFVAGVLGSTGVVSKYSGYDSNSNIIVIKALDKDGETTTTKILQAMQWVVKNREKYNIKVVCMSFGSVRRDSDPLVYGADILWKSGIVVVTAAGNSGPQGSTIMSPGASKRVITVGALDTTKDNFFKVAGFSSRGPVKNYYKPDIMVPGVDIISDNVYSFDKRFYTQMSGTSMSTPMVAGIASLLLSYNPNYTPDQIKYMLIKSCVVINGDRNIEGYGRLDLSKLILL